jgi:hypothetical protein
MIWCLVISVLFNVWYCGRLVLQAEEMRGLKNSNKMLRDRIEELLRDEVYNASR